MRGFATALALSLLAACSGARLEGGVYRAAGVAFRVGEVPASWRALDVSGARVAFRDDAAGATTFVNARCGEPGDDAPLVALTQHLFFLLTDRQVDEQGVVPFDGREALHTRMRARLDGVPKAYDVYVLKKDGCVYDLVQIAEPERAERARPAFEAFARGFRALGDEK